MKTVRKHVKVLYIAGAGHSGSTLLDIVLGSHPDIRGVGELQQLPHRVWNADEYCSCGARAKSCPFWSEVWQLWEERAGTMSFENYYRLQDSFTRLRRWPRLLRERRKQSLLFKLYAGYTYALFEAICEVSGNYVIVDSSKSPSRAFALSLMPGIELYLIHLICDGRGVAASYKKSWRRDLPAGVIGDFKSQPVWKTAAVWLVSNLEAELVRYLLGTGRSIRLRYESYVSDPAEALATIGRLADLDLPEVSRSVSAGDAVRAKHNIAGNHRRMSRDIRLRPDAGRWNDWLSTAEQEFSWPLMGWLLSRYGYKKRSDAAQ